MTIFVVVESCLVFIVSDDFALFLCRLCKNWEVASHGYREMDYTGMDEELENEHLQRCIQIHEQLIGKRPVGIYFGKVRSFSWINVGACMSSLNLSFFSAAKRKVSSLCG